MYTIYVRELIFVYVNKKILKYMYISYFNIKKNTK